MDVYLLKSSAILAILLLFYKLMLEREDMHLFNRFYLLAALAVAIAVPFVSFSTYVEMPYQLVQIQSSNLPTTPTELVEPFPYSEALLWAIFAIGALYFGLRFLLNLMTITKRIRQNPKVKTLAVTNVLLQEDLTPHTFLDYIFLNKGKFESGVIPLEVLEHEKAHALQKHSWDILLLELLQIVLWFHPLVYLLKREIKLNHEFLADKAVLQKGINLRSYQQILLSFSSNDIHSNLVHPINYSSIKKRFTVMKTQSSKKAVWLRSLLVLPLMALLLYGFSTKEILFTHSPKINLQDKATEEMLEEYNKLASYFNSSDEIHRNIIREDQYLRMKYIYSIMTPEQKKAAEVFPGLSEVTPSQPAFQEKATKAMVEEYNKLVTYYRSRDEDYMVLRPGDFARMNYIYELMTPEQKKGAEEFPTDLLPPPPPPPSPPVGEPVPEPPTPPSPTEAAPLDVTQAIDPAKLPPTPPPNPVDYVKELAAEGGRFWLDHKEIEPEEVLNVLKNGKKISIKVIEHNGYPATVILSSD